MASPTLHARDAAAAAADDQPQPQSQPSLQQPVSSSSPANPATPAAAVEDPTPAVPSATTANPPPLDPSSSDPLDPPGTSTTIQDPSPSMASPPPDPSSAPDTAPSPHPPPSPETQPQPQPATTTTTTLSASETRESKTSDPAIGPPSDVLTPSAKESDDAGQSLVINLLLTTGARHPFKIDGKYLRKRQVEVPDGNPFAMSVYTLKELIWREWRSEWEPRPSSPGSIRLISFGKLLEDKSPLSDSRFTQDAPNVVHMTVKPQEVVDEEDAKANKASSGRDRDGGDPSPHCRCVIL
ncbi:hypothetical protein FQN55_006161 [Onygenales sp. PD_40]|nr:hypothetical protein FQN55_006161 [Onygenales sp. PD_40]KAK2800513.1 hypothetical protein FQN51_006082 [Onygenales sp. PD_10]